MAFTDPLFQLGYELVKKTLEKECAPIHGAASKKHHKSTAAPSLDVRATRYSFPTPPQEGVEPVSQTRSRVRARSAA
jgi:hypothetical protein